jgi:hypothetical protein
LVGIGLTDLPKIGDAIYIFTKPWEVWEHKQHDANPVNRLKNHTTDFGHPQSKFRVKFMRANLSISKP